MKTTIAILVASVISLASTGKAMHEQVKQAPVTVSSPVTVEAEPVLITLPTMTIEGRLPEKKVVSTVAHVKHYVWGPVYENRVGGHNSDCEWK